MNTGVGSLFFLQVIFLTQESNRDLLHCRWILYQLTYQGSPNSHLTRDQTHAPLQWKLGVFFFLSELRSSVETFIVI